MPSMVRLEVFSGPLKGQWAFVKDRGSLVVGRRPDCGLIFPEDLSVSREHFRIEFESPSCRLVHISQTCETFVNGTPVTNIELNNGDEIAIGSGHKIRFTFEDVNGATAKETLITDSVDELDSAHGFAMSTVSCGWNLYESNESQISFKTLLKLLNESENVFAIIDFHRIGMKPPADLRNPMYLFSWMETPLREQYSPVLVSIKENPPLVDLISSAWLKDGIVCFGSKLEMEEQFALWQNAIGVHNHQPGEGVMVYFWPSILNSILTSQSSEKVAPLLRGLSWMFAASPESPGHWRLFASTEFAPEFTKNYSTKTSVNTPKS